MTDRMGELLAWLLTAPVGDLAGNNTVGWWERGGAAAAAWQRPVDRAIAGGFVATRVGYAFALGYAQALLELVPDLDPSVATALCITEAGGAHPRAIATSLRPAHEGGEADGWRLAGQKQWVTLGDRAAQLLVAASLGVDEAGLNRLVLVRVPVGAPGVVIERLADTAFVPEIGHAAVRLHEVAVAAAAILPGDGYLRYIKPFRTIEDIHVHAALAGHLLRMARRYGWPEAVKEELVALLLMVRALAGSPPDQPATHVALAGALGLWTRFLTTHEALWQQVDEPVRARWERDRPLLNVAGRARALRREAAWRALQ